MEGLDPRLKLAERLDDSSIVVLDWSEAHDSLRALAGGHVPTGEAKLVVDRAHPSGEARKVVLVSAAGEAMVAVVSALELARSRGVKKLTFVGASSSFQPARALIETLTGYLSQHLEWTVEVCIVCGAEEEFRLLMPAGKPAVFRPWGAVRPKSIRGTPLARGQKAVVLVVDQNPANNWYRAFKGQAFQG